jgi:two-component system, cell cycle response regulator
MTRSQDGLTPGIASHGPGQALTVLLVEDHPAVARLIQELLDDHAPIHLTWVQTLAAALVHLRDDPVDVVLLDLGLPDSQGLDTVARLVRAHPAFPVVVLTAHDDELLARAALKEGAEDYVSKGALEANMLIRALRYACERKRAEAALREAHAYTTQIIQHVQDGLAVYDRALCPQVWNPAMTALTGVPADQVVGRPASEAPSPWGTAPFIAALERARSGEVVTLPELAVQPPDGVGVRWLAVTLGLLRDATGALLGVIGSVRDITLRKEAEEVLRAQSLVDDLTGLQNRRGFLALAAQALRQAERSGAPALLVFADLDGLKALNDTRGHAAGDQALQATAGILRQTFRSSDILGRLGGDEFAVLAHDTSLAGRDAILARFAAGLQAHNATAVSPLALSLGVAAYDPERPCTVDVLLAQADAAMYEQKSAKRDVRASREGAR